MTPKGYHHGKGTLRPERDRGTSKPWLVPKGDHVTKGRSKQFSSTTRKKARPHKGEEGRIHQRHQAWSDEQTPQNPRKENKETPNKGKRS